MYTLAVQQCPLVWHKKAPKRWNSWRNKSFTRFWGLGKLQKGIAKQEVLASFSKKWKTKSISWACLLAMVMGTKREGAGAKERQLYRLRAQITVKRGWANRDSSIARGKSIIAMQISGLCLGITRSSELEYCVSSRISSRRRKLRQNLLQKAGFCRKKMKIATNNGHNLLAKGSIVAVQHA